MQDYLSCCTNLALSFVLGLLNLCSFCSASHSVMFDSMFPFLLCCLWSYFAGHFENTVVPYLQRPKVHYNNTTVQPTNYLLDLCREHGWDWHEKYTSCIILSHFSQHNYCYSTNANVFTVWRMKTYIHTDTTCIQHVNVGLAQACPNNRRSWNLWDSEGQRAKAVTFQVRTPLRTLRPTKYGRFHWLTNLTVLKYGNSYKKDANHNHK